MIIREEQMEAFKPQADAAFVKRVVLYLRENHPDVHVHLPSDAYAVEQIPDETLCELVRHGIARAREYGMSWQSSLTAFVVLMFVVAPNFDQHPLIQRVLRDENVQPNSRIDQFWERTSEQNWEAAKENYDAVAWHLKGMITDATES